MSHDDLQIGIRVENARQNQPDALSRGFDGESPARSQECRKVLDVIVVIDLGDGPVWRRRVDVNGDVEFLSALEDGPETLVIEKETVRQTMNHRAFEAELRDTTFEFLGSCLRIRRRQ